jgi:hypothetical protein
MSNWRDRIREHKYRNRIDPIPDDARKSGKWDFAAPCMCVCTGCFIAVMMVLILLSVE